jgi:hypothetical protein
VHIFVQPGGGQGHRQQGHRQLGDDPRHTMTNAMISQVTPAGQGKALTVSYPGGQQKIVVMPETPIIGVQGGVVADLTPGMSVTLLARPADSGPQTALVIMVGKDGAKPPI